MRFSKTIAAVASSAALAGGLLLAAGPASASGCSVSPCSVNTSVVIGQTVTFTLSTNSLALNGSAGGASVSATALSGTVATNDAAGYTVATTAQNATMTPTAGPNFIPIGTMDVWGGKQASAGANPGTIAAGFYPLAMSNTAASVTDMSASSTTGDNFTDEYGFGGTGVRLTNATGPFGVNIGNIAPSTYSDALTVTVVGN